MAEIDLKALQQNPVAEIQKSLGDLDRDQLTELLALEADANAPRETLTKAIAARLEKMDADDEPPQEDATPAKPAAPKAPAYQHPDYDGPLTIEQSEWRNHNIKPARVQKTK